MTECVFFYCENPVWRLQVTFSTGGKNSTDSVLRPQSLRIVTFWHFCVKVPCQGFQKAFVAFLAAGYCFIPPASTVEGQVCVGRRRHGAARHIQGQYRKHRKKKHICSGLIKNTVSVSLSWCFCMCSY